MSRDRGVTVAAVPWARHGVGHTRAFDDQIAWLAVHTSKTAVVELMRVAWRTVGAVIGRVVGDARALSDPFDGLVRIGIDEISYKRGHKYLTVVVDHDTGRLVWAAPRRDMATLTKFFTLVGPQRCANIRLVSADAAGWIATVVREAVSERDVVRGSVPHGGVGDRPPHWPPTGRARQGRVGEQDALPGLPVEGAVPARVPTPRPRGHPDPRRLARLGERCRIPPFVELAKRIAKHRPTIEATHSPSSTGAATAHPSRPQ